MKKYKIKMMARISSIIIVVIFINSTLPNLKGVGLYSTIVSFSLIVCILIEKFIK